MGKEIMLRITMNRTGMTQVNQTDSTTGSANVYRLPEPIEDQYQSV